MSHTYRLLLIPLISILILQATLPVSQALAQDKERQEPLKVVTKEVEPFVFIAGDEINGFSIELWEAVAEETGIEFEYEVVDSVQQQLNAMENNEADLAIAAISVTEERERSVDFSHDYFESGLGILTNVYTPLNFRETVLSFISPTFFRLLSGILIIVLLGGHVIWLVERGRNPEFPQSYFRGVWEGIWWSAVTVTTVGYGDKIPLGRIGRIFGVLWMFTGLLIIANFTASITSEFTVQRLQSVINGPEDLYGKSVVSVAGSTGDEWLSDRGIAHSTVETIDDAYILLDAKRVQAIVYDYPVLLYQVLQHPEKDYSVPDKAFSSEEYSIAFPAGSPLREEVNRALLKLQEDGTYDQIHARWYGEVFD